MDDQDQMDIDDAAWDQQRQELHRLSTEAIKGAHQQRSDFDERMKEWEKMWEPAFDRIFRP